MGGGSSTPPPSPCLSEPWRTMPTSTVENRNHAKTYKTQNVQNLRILLHGPVGAGKSSFINSVTSSLRGKVSNRALVDATSGRSFTLTYKTYKIKDGDKNLSFVFNDIMGYERSISSGVQVSDVVLALKGHVREGYQFDPNKVLMQDNPGYNREPSLDDRVHVLVCVIPAGDVSRLEDNVVEKLRQVRLAASGLGIPQLAILTKVDEACPEVKKDINNIYKSKYLKKQVEKMNLMIGVPINCIFLLKNYESEIYTLDGVDAPILTALKQMLTYGDDYLCDM